MSQIKVKLIGITPEGRIEALIEAEKEMKLQELLKKVLMPRGLSLEEILERLRRGSYVLFINGEGFRGEEVRGVIVKPGDEVAVIPVAPGGCAYL